MRRMLFMLLIIILCTGVCFARENVFGDMKPSGIRAAGYNYSKIRVSWEDMEDADGYIVYRSSSENGKYKKVYETENAQKTWYINTNRKGGQVWWYKVRGYKMVDGKKVYTQYSKAVSGYARPNKVAVTDVSSSGFIYRYLDLRWKKVLGASGYQVYMKERGAEKFSFMGNFKEPGASIEIPDTTKQYDLKVRAYQVVDGKKVYGYFSSVVSYEFDWTEADLIEAGESYIREQWLDATFSGTLASGEPKNPYNGTSWLAVWPKRFSLYEPWEDVKAELLAAIDADVKMQGQIPQDVCFYVTPDNDENWVTVYLLS